MTSPVDFSAEHYDDNFYPEYLSSSLAEDLDYDGYDDDAWEWFVSDDEDYQLYLDDHPDVE